jgi:hypothetical protein
MRPYKLIVTTNTDQTLGHGTITHHATMLDAANAFVNTDAPYRQVIYDDGRVARELDRREQRLLEDVCDMLGYEVAEA